MAEQSFRYSALDSDGNPKSGTIQATSHDQALEMLARQDLTVSELVPVGGAPVPSSSTPAPHVVSTGRAISISGEDLAAFAYELSALLKAGVSLAPALELMVRDGNKDRISPVILDLLRDVRAGTPFSNALENYPNVFPPIFPALVRSGEGTGGLDAALLQISGFLEKIDEVKNRILSALSYPVVVCSMAMGIITTLFMFMVPRFKEIYAQIGVPVPAFTAAALSIGELLDTVVVSGVIVLIVISPFLRRFINSAAGRRFMDKTKLQLPLLGNVFLQVALANFNKTLALLHTNGVNLHQGVEMAAAACGNEHVRRLLDPAVVTLRQGKPLSESLGAVGLYSQKMLGMIEAGEKSGNLSDMLTKMGEFSENRTQHQVERLLALLEPLTIGFIGMIVGAAVLTLGAPLMNIGNSIQ